MTGARFDDLYSERRGSYGRPRRRGLSFEGLNEYLRPRELELYRDREIEHALVFVVGLPRSGTTLLTQVLAYCLDAGYVNNFAARFWLAPVHGLRLSRLMRGTPSRSRSSRITPGHARCSTSTSSGTSGGTG